MISLISWAPFLIVAVICGLAFAFKGAKRGSLKAAISVISTVISTVLTVIVAKLLGTAVAGAITPMVSDALKNSVEGIDPEMLVPLASSLASAVAATVLYIPLFIILASVIKAVVSLIFKHIIPEPKHVLDRIGGITVSVIDALLVSLLVFLPIYGTLSVVKDVTSVIAVDENDENMELLNALTEPVIVDIAGNAPFSLVYDELLTFKYEEHSISVPKVVRSASDIVSDVVEFNMLENKFSDGRLLKVILHDIEDALLENEFVTDIVCQIAPSLLPDINMGSMGKISIPEYYTAISDGKLLRYDLSAFIDMLEAMIDCGMLEATEGGRYDVSKIDADALSAAFGRTLNHSNSLASFKNKMIKDLVSSFADKLTQEGEQGDDAINALIEQIKSMPETPYTGEQMQKEGEAIYMLVSGLLVAGKENQTGLGLGFILEGLARHPMIGTDTVLDTAQALLTSSGMPQLTSLTESIKSALTQSISKPVSESTFPSFCDTAYSTAQAFTDIVKGDGGVENLVNVITSNKETLLAVKDTVSKDLLEDIGMAEGEQAEKIQTVVDTVFDTIIQLEIDEENIEKEAEALNELLEVVTEVTSGENDVSETVMNKVDDIIDICADSEIIESVLDKMTEDEESDPTGLFSEISDEAKEEISSKIDSYIEENGDNSVLEKFKAFLGINANE